MKREDIIRGFRELADFLEAHPEVPFIGGAYMAEWVDSKAQLAMVARSAAPVVKEWEDDRLRLKKHFPGGLEVGWLINRKDICTQVVVGTKKVTKPVYAAPEKIGEETVTVEIKEWRCTEPLLSN